MVHVTHDGQDETGLVHEVDKGLIIADGQVSGSLEVLKNLLDRLPVDS